MRVPAVASVSPFVRPGVTRSGLTKLGVLSLLLFAAACASTPRVTPPGPTGPGPGPVSPPTPVEGLSLSALPGWAEEDHLAAFRAYVAGCAPARRGGADAVCLRARALSSSRLSPSEARAFLEASFVATEARTDDGRAGLFGPPHSRRRVRRPGAQPSGQSVGGGRPQRH
jgi:membrane-bound lytic murein transglycosylase A